jgi:hypothetical protein
LLITRYIIVGFDEDETIEVVVGKMLTKQNKTIATAEVVQEENSTAINSAWSVSLF